MKMWESEKHRSRVMQVEGFRGHVATDGSLSGKTGKWRACGWAAMQLDSGEETERLLGMYGSILGPAYHQEGGADGHFMPSQESDWTHQGACRQQWDY